MRRRSPTIIALDIRKLPNERWLHSNALRRVGYDSSHALLYAEFRARDGHHAGIYCYYDVPPTVFEALLRAPSHGVFMNIMVKSLFDYDEVELHG